MIQQPTNITPSSFGSLGNGVVDLSGGTLDVTWQINGESPLYAYQIDFYDPTDLEQTVYSTGKQSITPVWGRSYTGDYVPYTASLSGISTMTNGNAYVFTIRQWYGSGADDYVDQIQPSYFITRTAPTVSITAPANPFEYNEITLSSTYAQADGDALNWFRWVITDDNGNTIHDSGRVYGTGNIQCYYDGLFTDRTYTATIEVETSSGQTATDSVDINVSYVTEENTGTIDVEQGDCFVHVSWDSLRQIYGEATGDYYIDEANDTLMLQSGSDVLWDEMNGEPFSFDKGCWAWCGTIETSASTKLLSIIGASDTLDYYVGGNTVIVKYNGNTIKTVNVPIGIGDTIAIAQSDTNLYIYRQYQTGGLLPAEDLYPDTTLYPSDSDGGYAVSDYSTTLSSAYNYNLTAVQLFGECLHRYIWIASGTITQDTLDEISNVPTEPTQTANDVFYCNFTKDLNAGSLSDYSGRIEGWSIYRSDDSRSVLKHIADLSVEQSFVNDFSAVSQTTYQYHVFPYGENIYITQPLISDEFTPIWWCYALIVAEEQADGYTYVKNEAYKFGLNVSSGAMSNNNTPSVLQNFTGVPYVQISPDNYMTGQLSALIGRVQDNDYYDSVPMRDAIMALSTSTDAMFLKDRKGSIWKIRPTAPISITTNDRSPKQDYSVSLTWAQIESGTNFTVIGTESA